MQCTNLASWFFSINLGHWASISLKNVQSTFCFFCIGSFRVDLGGQSAVMETCDMH